MPLRIHLIWRLLLHIELPTHTVHTAIGLDWSRDSGFFFGMQYIMSDIIY